MKKLLLGLVGIIAIGSSIAGSFRPLSGNEKAIVTLLHKRYLHLPAGLKKELNNTLLYMILDESIPQHGGNVDTRVHYLKHNGMASGSNGTESFDLARHLIKE